MSQRRLLPNRRASEIINFTFEGRPCRASGSRYTSGELAELFLDIGKAGSEVQRQADDAAILVSLALQHGAPVAALRHSVTGPIGTALSLLSGDAL